MSDAEKAYQTTPASTLGEQIMNPCIAKNEREWWAAAEIERLREANEMMLTDIRRTDVDMLAFKAEIERLRAALVALRDGCETRPVGTRYREDGQPSKHDKCIHGVWMYEDCGQCVSLFVEAALAQKANDVC